MTKILALGLPLVLALTACTAASDQPESTQPAEPAPEVSAISAPTVVVSNSILGSVVGDILACAVGDTDSMTVLMPLGTDPHDFQPSSEQVASMVRADVVIVNGLGLELGLEGGIDAAKADGGVVFEVAEYIDPILWTDVGDDHDHDHGHSHGHSDGHDDDDHGHGAYDPHFWFDMSRMAVAAELLGAQLAQVSGESVFADCGLEAATEIRSVEADVEDVLRMIPADARLLVTDHEALAYFAEAYDFTIIGVVIPGGSTLGAPDSRALAKLVTTIKRNNVSALFGNAALNPAVLEALAAEVGDNVQVVELFVESLGGPGSEASSYLQMMLTNATRISQALTD
jgi:zinc/manganese transport system substrate-binding protein